MQNIILKLCRKWYSKNEIYMKLKSRLNKIGRKIEYERKLGYLDTTKPDDESATK